MRAALGSEAFYRRAAIHGRSGIGRFYTQARLDSISSVNVHMLLARDPAVRVVRGRFNEYIVFSARGRQCLPGVFYNGVRLRYDPETDLTTQFQPGQIEGIEIYPVEAFVPPELHVEGCGSLAIWTRSPTEGNPFTRKRLLTAAGVAAGLMLLLRL